MVAMVSIIPSLARVVYINDWSVSQKTVRRGGFRSVQELEQAIQNFLSAWKAQPTPFVWTASVEKILEKVARCRRRLEQATSTSTTAPAS